MGKTNLSLLIYKFLVKENIILSYIGLFDNKLVTSILNSVKEKNLFDKSLVSKRVYSILVESLENVIKHSDDLESNSFLFVYKYSSHYCIVTGNRISNDSISEFKNQLNNIKKSSELELKNLYKQQIFSDRLRDNCAGLGMFDIALKSRNKFDFKFISINEEFSIYMLQIRIDIL